MLKTELDKISMPLWKPFAAEFIQQFRELLKQKRNATE